MKKALTNRHMPTRHKRPNTKLEQPTSPAKREDTSNTSRSGRGGSHIANPTPTYHGRHLIPPLPHLPLLPPPPQSHSHPHPPPYHRPQVLHQGILCPGPHPRRPQETRCRQGRRVRQKWNGSRPRDRLHSRIRRG
ncbi:hypothetical protein Pfo_001930 [Paulownia fortunei]|nr:hypothetical protein Pfo_001930 [Paulownia fortunei]